MAWPLAYTLKSIEITNVTWHWDCNTILLNAMWKKFFVIQAIKQMSEKDIHEKTYLDWTQNFMFSKSSTKIPE